MTDRKPKKHGEIWIKTANIGDFMEQNEAIKDTVQQSNWLGDNFIKIYEYNDSHSS